METTQIYSSYDEIDQNTWSALVKNHLDFNFQKCSSEYQEGFLKLELDTQRIMNIADLSERLKLISGWTLTPVEGFIPPELFFNLLLKKVYPVTVLLRKPEDLNFSEQPDIFHDIYGHVPLLTNDKFCSFLKHLSDLALDFIDNDLAIKYLTRLYWFTFETGVIREGGTLKPYGGAIITSRAEIKRVDDCYNDIQPFDIIRIFDTEFDPYKLQNVYFYINSFDSLFELTDNLGVTLVGYLNRSY